MTSSFHRQGPRAARAAALCGLSLALAACATTRQTRSVEPRGFLRDYTQLQKGEVDEAQLRYINPNANFSQYDSIILDSVTIWHDDETEEISQADQQMLTDYLYTALHEQLSQDYRMVVIPGPGVMRVRAAITEGKGSRVVGKTITSIVPQLRLLGMVVGFAADTKVFVGAATIEAEILDSMTRERLAAAVDERAGTKALRTLGGGWKDVRNIFDYWAERLRERLAELRK